MDLKEWTVHYVKHKDLIHRKLVDYEIKEDSIEFKYKDGIKIYIVRDNLDDSVLKLDGVFVCLNTEENLEFLIDFWRHLVNNKEVSILFVNIVTGSKWMINPHTHDKIADPDTLEQGLRAMFEAALE